MNSMSMIAHIDHNDTPKQEVDPNLITVVSEHDAEDVMNEAFVLEHSAIAMKMKEQDNNEDALSEVKDKLSTLEV